MTDHTPVQSRYSAVAMTLHWLIAALIICNVGLGWYAGDLPRGDEKIGLMQWHKTFGVSILLLSILRLGWRLTHRPPVLNPHLKRWERLLAHIVHWSFYVIMIGMPLTGWITVSASALIKVYPISMYGLFDWPALSFLTDLPVDQRNSVQGISQGVHDLLAKALVYVLLPLHVLGALKHQFIDKDNELARMIPFLKR